MSDNITRIPIAFRKHIRTKPTVQQMIHGIARDLEGLPQHPSAADVLALAERLADLGQRIERGEVA